MGNDLSKEESRAVGGTVGGSTTLATSATGIGLMVLGGPIGMVAGGVLLGTGIASGVNTVQQCVKDEKFDYAQWGISAGIGAAGGAVAAPFSAAGGAAASLMSSTVAKVGTTVAAEVVGGALSGTTTKVIEKAAKDELDDLTWGDIGKAALVGGVASGVGASAGQVSGKLVSAGSKTVGKVASKGVTALRVTGSAFGGAAGGAGSAALATFVDNALHHGEFRRDQFIKYMSSLGVSSNISEKLWNELCQKGIVVNEEVKDPLPDSVHFSDELEPYRECVKELIAAALDLGKGVGDAALVGAVSGGVTGAVAAGVETHKLKKQIRTDARKRAEQVKSGAKGGSVEIEAYARANDKRVTVHHEDGKVSHYGSKSAQSEVHVSYDTRNEHYSPADASGTKLASSASSKPGECLFEALAPGRDPAKVRQETAKFMSEHPTKMKHLTTKELHCEGSHIGGGKKRTFLSSKEHKDVMDTIENCKELTSDVKSRIKKSADLALSKVQKMSDRSFAEVLNNPNGQWRCDEFHIHSLDGPHAGRIAVDVHPTSSGHMPGRGSSITNPQGALNRRSGFRIILDPRKGGLKLTGFSPSHDYTKLYQPDGTIRHFPKK